MVGTSGNGDQHVFDMTAKARGAYGLSRLAITAYRLRWIDGEFSFPRIERLHG